MAAHKLKMAVREVRTNQCYTESHLCSAWLTSVEGRQRESITCAGQDGDSIPGSMWHSILTQSCYKEEGLGSLNHIIDSVTFIRATAV